MDVRQAVLLWQLQNALQTAGHNITEHVTFEAWPEWIGYLLEMLDSYCEDKGYSSADMLLAIHDLIDSRLQTGGW